MIAAYQRISRADGDLGKDGKDKSNSIENQKELILRYISCKESLQNVPVMDFVDDGYTGSNFDRPGFQQMMDGVRNGKIDTIIVKDLSRFGRDYIGVGEYMEQIFPLLGVRLIAINDNYDSNNYKGTTLGMDVVVSNLVNTMYCRDAGKKLRTANQVKWRKDVPNAQDTVSSWLADIGISKSKVQTGTPIKITVGEVSLDGILYDTELAEEIKTYFPLTISMVGYGGREYYGGVEFYPEHLEGGQKNFENGDITYCEAHHNMAIFYAQTDNPVLSVDVIPIGRVTSDLSVFENLDSREEVIFSLAE